VTVPPHRFDLAIEEDLIEELVRVHGYQQVPVPAPVAGLGMPPGAKSVPRRRRRRRVWRCATIRK
jgi:phenylalanyl-tRNA synthetase beta chain